MSKRKVVGGKEGFPIAEQRFIIPFEKKEQKGGKGPPYLHKGSLQTGNAVITKGHLQNSSVAKENAWRGEGSVVAPYKGYEKRGGQG